MTAGKSFPDIFALSEEASRLKKEGKQIAGHSFLIV